MLDVSFSRLIDYCAERYDTSAVMRYVESIPDARLFTSAARGYARTTPLVDVGPNFRAVATWTDDRKPRKPVPSGGSTLVLLLMGSAGLAGMRRLQLN